MSFILLIFLNMNFVLDMNTSTYVLHTSGDIAERLQSSDVNFSIYQFGKEIHVQSRLSCTTCFVDFLKHIKYAISFEYIFSNHAYVKSSIKMCSVLPGIFQNLPSAAYYLIK